MRAINNYIVVEKKKDEPKKVAGLILNEATDVDNRYVKATILTKDEARYKKAKVISVGNMVEGVSNKSTIYYDGHCGHNISYDNNIYKVIKMQDVVLVE